MIFQINFFSLPQVSKAELTNLFYQKLSIFAGIKYLIRAKRWLQNKRYTAGSALLVTNIARFWQVRHCPMILKTAKLLKTWLNSCQNRTIAQKIAEKLVFVPVTKLIFETKKSYSPC